LNPPLPFESDDDDRTIPYFSDGRDKVHDGGEKVDDEKNGDKFNSSQKLKSVFQSHTSKQNKRVHTNLL